MADEANVTVTQTQEQTERKAEEPHGSEPDDKAMYEKAGCTADMSYADICEAIVAVATEVSVDGLTGESMTWSANGEVSKSPRAMVIKDGAYTAA